MPEEFIASANLTDIISIMAGILGILVAIIEITLRVREYLYDRKSSDRIDRRGTDYSSHKSGLRILRLFRKNYKSVRVKNKTTLQKIQPKPSNQKAEKVFIGYKVGSQPDEELVDLIQNALEKRGHKPFLHTMLPIGVEWAKSLQRKIESSDFLIVLLSEDSVKSEMLLEEVTFAEIYRIKHQRPKILPVRVQYL